MLYVYLILLILFIGVSVYQAVESFSTSALFIQIAGFVAIFHRMLQELSKKWLSLYFFIERTKLKFSSDTTSKWWFHARYDGISIENIPETLDRELRTNERFKIKLSRRNDTEFDLDVNDGSFYVSLSFTKDYQGVNQILNLDLVSKKIEVSYGHAKSKLQNQIEPFLQFLDRTVKPENRSFDLNVKFSGNKNPFFNVYVANLMPEQVEDFRVVLHVDGNSPSSLSDKVIIAKDGLQITADSSGAFKKLAEDFILLTPDTQLLIGGKHG